MRTHEYSDDKMIRLHDLSSILVARLINKRSSSCGGKYSPQEQHCWRCCQSWVCRWLNRVETGIEVMQREALMASLAYAVEIVHKQFEEENHYVDCW